MANEKSYVAIINSLSVVFRASRLTAAMAVLLISASARGVVLTFDDLDPISVVTATGYAGLTWEYGNAGSSGVTGYWCTVGPVNNHPQSPPRNLVNGFGPTRIGIGFPSPVDMQGVFVDAEGNYAPASSIRAEGYLGGVLVASTPWLLGVTTTPQWFDMSALSNVDRVVFVSNPVFDSASIYGLDDLTFTYIPEPTSLAMLGLAGAGLFARRRGRCGAAN